MVERTINVRGVNLTKADLEQALDKPKRTFNPGDIVRWKGESSTTRFVVASESVAEALRARHTHISPRAISLISLHDGESYSPRPESIEHTGEAL